MKQVMSELAHLGIFYVVEWVIDMLVNPHAGIPHQ
jgi:hypothetical protein